MRIGTGDACRHRQRSVGQWTAYTRLPANALLVRNTGLKLVGKWLWKTMPGNWQGFSIVYCACVTIFFCLSHSGCATACSLIVQTDGYCQLLNSTYEFCELGKNRADMYRARQKKYPLQSLGDNSSTVSVNFAFFLQEYWAFISTYICKLYFATANNEKRYSELNAATWRVLSILFWVN